MRRKLQDVILTGFFDVEMRKIAKKGSQIIVKEVQKLELPEKPRYNQIVDMINSLVDRGLLFRSIAKGKVFYSITDNGAKLVNRSLR